MQLTPTRLGEHIERHGLLHTYLVYGDEPLQQREARDELRQAARDTGIDERLVFDVEAGFDWRTVTTLSANLSLFSNRRLVEIRLAERKLDKTGAQAISEIVASAAGPDVFLLSAGKLDRSAKSSKWFKACAQHGAVIECRTPAPKALQTWLVARARQQDCRLTTEAAELLVMRTEGNVLAAAQEIEKLVLANGVGELTLDLAVAAVSDSTRHDVFQMVDAAIAGDPARAVRILRGLAAAGTEPVLLAWACNRELRALAGMRTEIARGTPSQEVIAHYGVWRSRSALIQRALARLSVSQCLTLWRESIFIDWIAKGIRSGDPWNALECLVLAWSDKPLTSASGECAELGSDAQKNAPAPGIMNDYGHYDCP